MKAANPGPYLVRLHPLAEAQADSRGLLDGLRTHFASLRRWELATLSGVLGVVLAVAVILTVDNHPVVPSPAAGPVGGIASSPARPLAREITGSTADEKLVARNRRLEALVEVLRERRKGNSSRAYPAHRPGN